MHMEFLSHTHTQTHIHTCVCVCVWLPARSCDTQTDYTFVHLAALSHFTFLNIYTRIFIHTQNLKTSAIVFRARLCVSSYLES